MTRFSKEYFPSADTLVEYLNEFATRFDLDIRYNSPVSAVSRDEHGEFSITTNGGPGYRAKALLVATGLGLPYVPDIPGIELTEGYEDMSVDPADFENQTVLILGKGNSAFETADRLIASASLIHTLSPTPLKLAWQSRFVGHLRAVNNNLLDTYHLKSQNAVIDGIVHEIKPGPPGKLRVKFSSIHAENETEQLDYDRVLRCTGFRFDDSIYDSTSRPTMTPCGRLPLMTNGFEATSVDGMFFMGAPMQSLDYKRAQSAFIHGFRYNVRALFNLLERRYFGVPLPHEVLPSDPAIIAKAVLTRMNSVSSLWQQVGFLADLVVLPADGESEARYIHDVPYEYARERGLELSGGRDFYITMFRLGLCPGNPFDHPRSADPDEGVSSTAIHPTFELHRGGYKVQEHHVLEDFLGDWSGSEYLDSATRFFTHSMRGEEVPRNHLSDVRHIVRDGSMRLVNQASGD